MKYASRGCWQHFSHVYFLPDGGRARRREKIITWRWRKSKNKRHRELPTSAVELFLIPGVFDHPKTISREQRLFADVTKILSMYPSGQIVTRCGGENICYRGFHSVDEIIKFLSSLSTVKSLPSRQYKTDGIPGC